MRDCPKLQLLVFGNRHPDASFGLAPLALAPLDRSEQLSVARELSPSDPYLVDRMPEMLRNLCDQPMLLTQAVEFYLRDKTFPTQIVDIFQDWIDRVTGPGKDQLSDMVERQEALAAIAGATLYGPVSRAEAFTAIKQAGLPTQTLDALTNKAALAIDGDRVEIVHQALADFMRAKANCALDDEQFSRRLSSLEFRSGTWLAPLMVCLNRRQDRRNVLWDKIIASGLDLYLNALRYRLDLSDPSSAENDEDLSRRHLQEHLDGIEDVIDGFFPEIRGQLVWEFTGDYGDALALTGNVHRNPAEFFVAYRVRDASRPDIELGNGATANRRRYMHLDRLGFRLDSGRLLAVQSVEQAVRSLVKKEILRGSDEWLRHSTYGQVRYLMSLSDVVKGGMSFSDIVAALLPFADQVLGGGLSGGPIVAVGDLIEDVKRLGKMTPDEFWATEVVPLTSSAEDLGRAMQAYLHQAQVIFKELVETNFGTIKGAFGFYNVLPVRWSVTIVQRPGRLASQFMSWLPVADWSEAGSDVTFADKLPNFSSGNAAFAALTSALARLNRSSENVGYVERSGNVPQFDGSAFNGAYDGETNALRLALELLDGDLERAFSEMPDRDF